MSNINDQYSKIIITLKDGKKIKFDPAFFGEGKIINRLKAEGKEIEKIERVIKEWTDN